MPLKNLANAAAETEADVAARISARREKWAPHPDAPTVEDGDTTARIVVKVGGTTEMVEVERPNGRFSSYDLGSASIVHDIAVSYDTFLEAQKKGSK